MIFFFHLTLHQAYKLYSIVVSIRNAHDNADSYLCFYNVCIIVCALQCQKSNGHVYRKRFHFKCFFWAKLKLYVEQRKVKRTEST